MTKETLEHPEQVFNHFCDGLLDLDGFNLDLDPYTTEEKIIMARKDQGLSPHEISELVLKTLTKLPEFASEYQTDVAFNVLYETISDVINKR